MNGSNVPFQANKVCIRYQHTMRQKLQGSDCKPKEDPSLILIATDTDNNQQQALAIRFSNQNEANEFKIAYGKLLQYPQ